MASVNLANLEGRTPLHAAADRGHLPVVKLLLQHGAAVNAQDNNRKTPLQLAMANGHVDVALLLASASGMPGLATG